jgi:ABC-type lipoprotein release transport system permease subunit
MTRFQYILKTFTHYIKANLLVAIGVLISTMVLTGSLIIGDSVRYSLEQATFYRLGKTTHLVSVAERYFRQEMATEIEAENPGIKATPVLLLDGMAVAGGGQQRVNKVQIIGVSPDFEEISNSPVFAKLQKNEIAISRNLAERLKVKSGDNILVRIKKASLIPMNAPFVSAEETSVSLRATVKIIVSKEQLGRFSLKNSQTAPYNIFLSIGRLNRLMEFSGKANRLLISTELESGKVEQAVKKCLLPEDAGLQLKSIVTTNEIEISTERVFIEPKVSETVAKLSGANFILTYFVNEIEKSSEVQVLSSGLQGKNVAIPYSFVSSLNDSILANNEIILNRWAADDLGVKPGDSIRLKYLEIGPLRKLVDKDAVFVLKEVIPMDSEWNDPTRVPHLPGLSDAGHCREWDAGVPIDLDAIRDKDEKYWDNFKGTPKAFVSRKKALQLWSNRFGNYTAVRFAAADFDKNKYEQIFADEINPGDLGMTISPVREQGLHAARNGTDFSGLFIGLSFFILVASIVLTSLLFRLNLETRSSQIGLLAALGFQQKQVRKFFLSEGLVIAFAGGLAGLVVSVFYTQAVFKILNSLWFEIVRTNVLEIKILPATLVWGLVISLAVSLAAIFISVRKFQNRNVVELQNSSVSGNRMWSNFIYNALLYLSFTISIAVFIKQVFFAERLNPALFFLTGGLLLVGFLLLFQKILVKLEIKKRSEIRLGKLAQLNLSRNKSRSLTVVILFALATFLVVSTGSNKLDLFANAQKKTSGTGGFLYFAETTMPVLFDINDKRKRADEGIYEDFSAVQLRKVDGDDASCLNLNRIAQPAILGVDPELLAGRFSFSTRLKILGKTEPWELLNKKFDDGTIPAIADQTVIQWGLGMKTGDVVQYQNELGDTLRLKLIAGTAPSIFQGYILISNKNFLQNYPTSSGTNLFLIEGKPEQAQKIGEELQSVFRDYGWEMEPAAKRLVEFYSVTNTYLSIFLALGALGLLLGTIGLAVILARTILERRREIAVMQAIGFSEKTILISFIKEYSILLFSGVLIGFITAAVATFPAFQSTGSDASFSTVAVVVALVLGNGFVWIAGLSRFSLRKKNLVAGLRDE